ncbi:tetratricopeptide repeat protein [Methanocella arvoryzae]|uniref:Uncharacterized protein n=1 Tax=Methanocella arvoryzae (strain DSM 22066 / NBRC 105507 / MRE50) TaxID=351160 RepID=Q0W239_METAR|nr:tetratricopeptide repeat protein [Methanocella arvoryzae]CAJ37554.1 hypothetical protein RCIX2478 [Methanocella arvoryzae MRE50]
MWARDNSTHESDQNSGLAAADFSGDPGEETDYALKSIEECDLNTVLEMYHYTNGTILELNGFLSDAIHEYREAIRLNPAEGFYHYNLGVALLKNCEYNDAYKELCEAIRLNPEDYESRCALGDVYCAIGRSLMACGNLLEAIDSFREAVAIDPDYSDYHCGLGQALLELARSDEAHINEEHLVNAIAEFRTALGIDPESMDARISLGMALSLSQDQCLRTEGLKLLNEVLIAEPFNDDVRSCIDALTAGSHTA